MSLLVVKIGGGLAAAPDGLDGVCAAVAAAGQRRPILVVPGGGPFADTVREFDRRVGVAAGAAHWMAILGMDQYAYVLADRMPRAVLVHEPGAAAAAVRAVGVAVLAPSRWLRAADVLPHRWDVTSDSIAAFVAGALDAERLILVKPMGAACGGADVVDPYFRTALPAGLPVTIVAADRGEELARALRE